MEHKCQMIYSAIDSQDHKQALRLCDQFLKKHPSGPEGNFVQGLKVLALYRAGRSDEALSICMEIRQVTPPVTDTSLLETLSVVLKSMKRYGEHTKFYEQAYAKEPGEEKLAKEYFYCLVREGNWAVGQQVATKMFAKFKKEEYMWWGVVSMWMNGETKGKASPSCSTSSPPPLKYAFPLFVPPPSLLSISPSDSEAYTKHIQFHTSATPASMLVERMISKSFKDNKYANLSQQKVIFYLLLLQKQGKWEACLETLEDPKFQKGLQNPEGALYLRAQYHTFIAYLSENQRRKEEAGGEKKEGGEGGKTHEEVRDSHLVSALELLRQLLDEYNSDEWSYFLSYLDVLAILGGGEHGPRSFVSSTGEKKFDEFQGFLEELSKRPPHSLKNDGEASSPPKKRFQRGPFLARIEGHFRLLGGTNEPSPSEEGLKVLVDLILDYLQKFGSITVCSSDLRTYFSHLFTPPLLSHPTVQPLLNKILSSSTLFSQEEGGEITPVSELGEWQEGRKLGEVDLSLKLCRYFGFLFKGEKEGDEGEQERTERILFTICQLFYLHGQTLKPQTVVKALFTAPIHYRVPNPLPQNAVYSKGGEGGEEVSSYSIMEEEPKGGALPSTDHQQGDAVMQIACLLAIDLFSKSYEKANGEGEGMKEAEGFLRLAIALLNYALTWSPYNAEFKLRLMEVYGLIGASSPHDTIWKSLDIKSIQYDTLPHYFLPFVVQTDPVRAKMFCGEVRGFYSTADLETVECLVEPFRGGSFKKIPEFVQFHNRLSWSHGRASIDTTQLFLDLHLPDPSLKTSKEVRVAILKKSKESLKGFESSFSASSSSKDGGFVGRSGDHPFFLFKGFGELVNNYDDKASAAFVLPSLSSSPSSPSIYPPGVWELFFKSAEEDKGEGLVLSKAENVPRLLHPKMLYPTCGDRFLSPSHLQLWVRTKRLCSAVLLEGCKSTAVVVAAAAAPDLSQARGGGGRAGPKKAAGKGKGKRKAAPLNQQPQPKAPAAPAQICVPDNFSSVTLTSFLVELVENLVVLGSLPSSVVSSVPGLKAFLSTHVPKAVPTDVQPSPVSSLIQRIWGLLVLLPIILLGVEGLRKAHGEHEVAELVEGGQISLLLSQLAFVGSESCAIFEEVGTCVKEFVESKTIIMSPLFPLLSACVGHYCCWLATFSASWAEFCPVRIKKTTNDEAKVLKEVSQAIKLVPGTVKPGLSELDTSLSKNAEALKSPEPWLSFPHPPHLSFLTKIKEVKEIEKEQTTAILESFSMTLTNYLATLKYWTFVL